MQKSWIHYSKELCITQMNHWILVVAAFTVLSIFSATNLHLGFLLSLGIIPVFYYVLRLKTKRYFFFILLHLVPFGILPFCKENFVLLLVVAAVLVFYFVYSIKVKVTDVHVENPFIGPAAGVCTIAVCFFFHDKYGRIDIRNYYTIAFFVFLLVFFLYYFMENYVWFVTVQKNSVDNISERSLWIGGLKQLLIFVGVACVCMLSLINFEWLSFVVSKIGDFFVFLLRLLFSLITRKPPEEIINYDQVAQGGPEGGLLNFAHGNTSFILIILEKIAIAATIIGIGCFLVYSLYKFFRFLRKSFYQSKKPNRLHPTFNGTDVREQCEIIQTESYLKKLFTPRNHRDVARKVYKKYIIKHKQDLIGDLSKEHLSPLTAGECCERLDCLEVQKLYEKVRYSEEKISAADVKALKEKTKS